MTKRIALLLMCAAAVGACSASQTLPGRSTSTPLDASDIVRSAVRAMAAVNSYRVVSAVTTRTSKGSVTVGVDAEFERPDRIRTVTTVGGRTVTAVVVGGRTWVRDPASGRWTATPQRSTPHRDEPFSFLSSFRTVRLAGHERIGDADTYIIDGTVPLEALSGSFGSPAAPSGEVPVTVWIDTSTDRLLRVSERTAGAIQVDASLSGFGDRFGIAAPR